MRSLLIAVMVVGCGGDDASEVERQRPCDQLLEHMIDLSEAGAKNAPKELAAHRAAMRQAIGPRLLASCEQTMTTDQIDCAARAGDLTTATACTTAAAHP